MKLTRYVIAVIFMLVPFAALAQASVEKANTVLIHPGETIYATFERSGTALKLLRVSQKEKKSAQLVFKMQPFDQTAGLMLTVENRFDRDLNYKAQMRLLSSNKKAETSVLPVMAGKLTFEQWPHMIEELALYGFELKP